MVQTSKCVVGKCLSRVNKGRTENGKFQKVWGWAHKCTSQWVETGGWQWLELKWHDCSAFERPSVCIRGNCRASLLQLQLFSVPGCPSLWRVMRHWHWLPWEVMGSPCWKYSKAVWTQNWAAPDGPDWTVWLDKVTYRDVFQHQSLSTCDCPHAFPMVAETVEETRNSNYCSEWLPRVFQQPYS